uniref:hypothetical protein n=1 Tax=Mycobacterium avium TaxID=1764 RepID=UPI000B334876
MHANRVCPNSDLPQRLSLFGHTRFACPDVELLDALPPPHDLHLWLPPPGAGLGPGLARTNRLHPRRADTCHRAVAHPWLA